MEDATEQRKEAEKLERAKEKYEAVAEQAKKKMNEERSKLAEASLKEKMAHKQREAAKHAKPKSAMV